MRKQWHNDVRCLIQRRGGERIMGKWVKMFSVLLVVFMASGCLWDVSNGSNIGNTWEAKQYNVFWTASDQDVELQCEITKNNTTTWQTFAKGKTDKIA